MKINESDFEYKGYRCVTTFTEMGYRCGYVGIPEGHPLYGKKEDVKLNMTIREMAEKETEVNKRNSVSTLLLEMADEDELVELGAYFNVHGGITYCSGGHDSKHPIESDLWWFGFDCGHCCDAPDIEKMEDLWGDDPKIRRRIDEPLSIPILVDMEVRTMEYVQEECKRLVDQIIDLLDNVEVLP